MAKMTSISKANLNTGDRVVFRNGKVRFCVLNTAFGDGFVDFGDAKVWSPMTDYADDLTAVSGNHDWDIVKVDKPTKKTRIGKTADDSFTNVFERVDVKRMTLDDVCKALGYTVAIIS